jgi:hypothetical protein
VTDESSGTSRPSTQNLGDVAQQVQPEQAENVSKGFMKSQRLTKTWSGLSFSRIQAILTKTWSGLSLSPVQAILAKMWSGLSLPRVQAIVAVLTGIVTITVGLHSLAQFSGPAASMGELVAVVKEAVSERSVTDATIEILTPQNALVATLTPDSKGRARRSLKEGTYVVRVNHPLYAREVRQIQVFPQQTIEIKASLRPGSGSPVEQAKRTVSDGVRAVRRAFGF